MSTFTKKHLGDAGEYYALSQFSFSGLPSTKMPDNWPEYDLIVDVNGAPKKISVKTRSNNKGKFTTEHCKFSADDNFDFIACIFIVSREEIRCWIIPEGIANKHGDRNNKNNPSYRHISYKQLTEEEELKKYEKNWSLEID